MKAGKILELWDVLTPEGKLTGKKVKRGASTLKAGEYHLVVHIWPISKDGAFLIQRRSFKKKLMPGEWAATGGAAIAGENSLAAAKRELYEELGIESDNLVLIKRIKKRNSFVDIYGTVVSVKINELKLQKSEVCDARWVNSETLLKMVEKGDYHNYGNEYFNIITEFAINLRRAKV